MIKKYWKSFIIISAFLISFLLATIVFMYFAHWRINASSSMPLGIWHVVKSSSYKKGQTVIICPLDSAVFKMAKKRYYVTKGRCSGDYEPLIKPIAAVAGDMVTVNLSGIWVNGHLIKNSKVIHQDALNRVLPSIPYGDYPVLSGTVWVIATYNPGSFDSRYFGALPVNNIQGAAYPVWVKLII